MILFVGKDTTLFRSSPIRYRGWLYKHRAEVASLETQNNRHTEMFFLKSVDVLPT